jgi:hypothetical protein
MTRIPSRRAGMTSEQTAVLQFVLISLSSFRFGLAPRESEEYEESLIEGATRRDFSIPSK